MHCPLPRRKRLEITGLLALVLVPALCWAAEKKELKSDTDKVNYSVGYQIGTDFRTQGVELDPEVMVQGIRDALKKNTPLLPPEQMSATLVNLKKKIVADEKAAAARFAAEQRKASAAFLADHAKQKGVTVLPSGVQYRVLKEGSGAKPSLKDEVKVHYRITRTDGREVGKTYGAAPRTFTVGTAIPGLQEVLPLMAEGATWEVVIPGGAAQGSRDLADDWGAVIYEMELLSVIPAKK